VVGSGITSYLHTCLDGLHTPKKDLIHYIVCVQPKILIRVGNVNIYAKVPTSLVDFKCYQKRGCGMVLGLEQNLSQTNTWNSVRKLLLGNFCNCKGIERKTLH